MTTASARLLYSFPHPLGSPGIGTTAWHQVQGVIEQGLDVTVACTSVSVPVDERARRIVETLRFAGRRVPHRLVGVDRALRLHDEWVARTLSENPSSFDVVHCWPLAAARTLDTARRLGVSAVRELPNAHTALAYELAAQEATDVGVDLPKGHSHRTNPKRLATEELEYTRASALLAPSDFVRSSFSGRGPHAPIVRHRYGFDPARFPSPGPRQPRPFTVAFVGSGEPRKGVHHALAAWHRSGIGERGARLIICGRFLPSYQRRLASLLAGPGIEEMPYTHDVSSVLRGADALVLPSVEEGSALVTYEAQASGCALLVSDATGAMFEPGRHGFVHAAGDVGTLAAQMRLLFGRPELLDRMRAAVLDRREVLSWTEAGRRLVAAYEEARSSCPTGAS